MTQTVHDDLAKALEADVAATDLRRIALFTGTASFTLSGANEIVSAVLNDRVAARFAIPTPPSSDTLGDVMSTFVDVKPDQVVAIGGGAVIDMAKAAALFAAQPDPLDIDPSRHWHPTSLPITAAPTTAGSGSEATPFAVMYFGSDKYSLYDPSLLPRRVSLDPSLIASVPRPIAAAAALDALAHCVESMWSTRSTRETISRAEDTLTTIVANLACDLHDDGVRSAMQQAAYTAGECIAVTRTTAAHALSYYLTFHHNIAHGHAALLTLGRVLLANEDVTPANCQDPRGVDHVHDVMGRIYRALGADEARSAAARLAALTEHLGLPVGLNQAGLTEAELPAMAASANVERLMTNPRRLTADDLTDIVKQSWVTS